MHNATSGGEAVDDPAAAKPTLLGLNQPARLYRGGAGIAALRGLPALADDVPEDFVGSTTAVLGSDSVGLSVLPDGKTLRWHVQDNPVGFLGPSHVDAYGSDTRLLVKLLAPGERLFVHYHPDDRFAALHLDCERGKSEGWIVTDVEDLDDPSAGHVYLGFREDVSEEDVAAWVAGQRVSEMLAALNKLPVKAGDTFFVPAGTPHAIGAGVTSVELQQPTDFSILLEWAGFNVTPAGRHLGLGYKTALGALDRTAWDAARLAHTQGVRETERPEVTRAFPPDADRFFRAEMVRLDGDLDFPAGFSILIVLDGEGVLSTTSHTTPLKRGACVLVPYGAGDQRITGSLEAVRCLPPAPPQTSA